MYGDDTTRSTFGSDVSVFDYDVVIWDPDRFLYDYPSYQTYMGLPLLSEDASVRFQADVKRRKTEFAQFVSSGRSLIVISRPEIAAYCATGEKKYSGTGRNQSATTMVTKGILQSAIPTEAITFLPARGQRISPAGDGPIQSLLRKYKDVFKYHAVLENAPGRAIATISGTDRVLGSITKVKSGGSLIVLPHVDLRDLTGSEDQTGTDEEEPEESDSDGYSENAPHFQADLLAAVETLAGTKTVSRPAWSHRFATAGQRDLQQAVVTRLREVEEAKASLALAQQAQDESEAQAQLFLGTGRALELEVKNVLELLGGEVAEPEPGRDDWRVTFPEGKAVVEVKGVSKSAAEKHAAQLEKWVSASYEETGELHKGLLIVNTWRETPLDSRKEPDFPEQMIGYSTTRNHALVTGLQLFVIRQQIEKFEVTAAEWRQRLLQTSGRLTGCDDWEKYLLQTSAEAEDHASAE